MLTVKYCGDEHHGWMACSGVLLWCWKRDSGKIFLWHHSPRSCPSSITLLFIYMNVWYCGILHSWCWKEYRRKRLIFVACLLFIVSACCKWVSTTVPHSRPYHCWFIDKEMKSQKVKQFSQDHINIHLQIQDLTLSLFKSFTQFMWQGPS